MTTITSEHYLDVVFDMPDGRQILIMVMKDGRYRLCERQSTDHGEVFGPPVWGSVVK